MRSLIFGIIFVATRIRFCFLIGWLVLLVPQLAAAQNGPNYACTASSDKRFAFKDLMQFARGQGIPKIFPQALAKPLGFGNSDLPVTRLSFLEDDIFRAIDVVPGNSDYILFRKVKNTLYLWKLDGRGKTVGTYFTAIGERVRIVPNSEHAAALTELCNYLFKFMYMSPQDLKRLEGQSGKARD
jgi:hypothetical protein